MYELEDQASQPLVNCLLTKKHVNREKQSNRRKIKF